MVAPVYPRALRIYVVVYTGIMSIPGPMRDVGANAGEMARNLLPGIDVAAGQVSSQSSMQESMQQFYHPPTWIMH